MARMKRQAKPKAREPRMPSDMELRRLKVFADYARARARAKADGVLDGDLPPELRVHRPSARDDEAERRQLEARIEFMIELEVRWRMAELGVPYTDEVAKRFEPFRFASDHRRKLEALEGARAEERRRAERTNSGEGGP